MKDTSRVWNCGCLRLHVVPRHKSLFAIPPPANLCFLYHVLLPIRKFLQDGNGQLETRQCVPHSEYCLWLLIKEDYWIETPKEYCRCASTYSMYRSNGWMVIIPCFQVQFLDHGHVTPHRVLHPEAGAMVLRMKVQWSISEVETPMPRFPQVASPHAICIENTQRYSTCLVGSNSWRLPVFIQLLYKNYNVATRNDQTASLD